MKIERLGKHVHLRFRTEVAAVNFERNLRKVLKQKQEEIKRLQKQHAPQLQKLRKKRNRGLWHQHRQNV